MKFSLKTFAAAALASLLSMSSAHALTVYSSVDEENARKLLDAFTKATGVETQMVFLSSGPALSRIEAEKANPQADVWFGAPSENHILAKERGLTEPYVSANASALSDDFKDKDGYYYGLRATVNVIAYNTKAVPAGEAPKTWKDLLAPKWKGKLVTAHPGYSGVIATHVLALSHLLGWDYFKALGQQSVMIVQSAVDPAGVETRTPSQINSACRSLVSSTTPSMPGSRCVSPRIALKVCVALTAPAAMPARACLATASLCPMLMRTPCWLACAIISSASCNSGATVISLMWPRAAS